MRKRFILFLGFVLLQQHTLTSWSATSDVYAKQREHFIEARKALGKGKQNQFRLLKSKLKKYPLYGYLEFDELRKNLSKAHPKQISEFLKTYQEQPTAKRLYGAWLHSLGKRKQWHHYLQFYTPQKSATLRCYQIRARLQTKPAESEHALKQGLSLWLVGKSQPDACDPVFKKLESSHLLTRDHRWERIRRAFANRKLSLAKHIAKKMPESDRIWVDRWRLMHKRPDRSLGKSWAKLDADLVREIVVHGLLRLARSNQSEAWKHWQRLSKIHKFTEKQQGQIVHDIALFAALNNHPDAADWLAAVPASAVDARIRQWRVRTALLDQDWRAAKVWIDVLEPAERDSDAWRYWHAVAQEKQGETQQAQEAFTDLSKHRSFYSFLAADRVQNQYYMKHEKRPIKEKDLQALREQPAMIRAHELLRADMPVDARREWRDTIAGLKEQQLILAANLADQWGWHDRAIATAAKAKYWSDLSLRFPIAHRSLIEQNAQQQKIDPALIYGVIRQESAFMEDARSRVGAMGLMQLMPGTAKMTSRKLGMRYPGQKRLLQAQDNIHLGTAYLRKMLDRYDNSPVLAAAAYNAGPHRVKRWLPEKKLPASLWLLRIPFQETHGYVQRVLAYATVFDWRDKRPVTRLSARMPDVNPAKQANKD